MPERARNRQPPCHLIVLEFLEIAAARGDELHPKLLALCESMASAPQHGSVARIDGMIQSGPNPNRSEPRETRYCRSAGR
jgi:hypothetical protein